MIDWLDASAERAETLAAAAAEKGLLFGSAVRYPSLTTDPAIGQTTARECSIIVPEGELQWTIVEPAKGHFDFGKADTILDFARAHSLQARGHALVWHETIPAWVPRSVTSEEARALLAGHVHYEASRYAGRIHTWDVVNEPLIVRDKLFGGMRPTLWHETIGDDYIDLALRTAAAADPHALLAINEFGLEYDDAAGRAKRSAMLRLIEQLRRRGSPLHVIGIQSHLDGARSPRDIAGLRRFLADIVEFGLAIQITELDVTDQDLTRDIPSRDARVASVYGDYLSTVLDEPAVKAVLTWGICDRATWLSRSHPRPDGLAVRPLPYDANLNPTPARAAILAALRSAPKRP